MKKVVKKVEKGELKEKKENERIRKRELFLRIMRELGKSEDILIRENETRIRI